MMGRKAGVAGVVLLLLAAAAGPAVAGDAAKLHVIGFSADGSRFAFEQFGLQDGSGFPYADVFLVDVADNAWVEGTPARVRLEDDGAVSSPEGVTEARTEAAARAQPFLRRAGIAAGNIGVAVIERPLTDRGADPHLAVFTLGPEGSAEYRLVLREQPPTPSARASDCAAYDPPVQVFSLDLMGPDGRATSLQPVGRLPASRGCAFAYRIAGAYLLPLAGQPAPDGGSPYALAVLIAVASYGFEGPDTRYLAVTARLPSLRLF